MGLWCVLCGHPDPVSFVLTSVGMLILKLCLVCTSRLGSPCGLLVLLSEVQGGFLLVPLRLVLAQLRVPFSTGRHLTSSFFPHLFEP